MLIIFLKYPITQREITFTAFTQTYLQKCFCSLYEKPILMQVQQIRI